MDARIPRYRTLSRKNLRRQLTAVLLSLVAVTAAADPCRLETPDATETARELVRPDTTLVRYCWYCDAAAAWPLRVRSVEFRHTEPQEVRAVAWADPEPTEHRFPLPALEQAEQDGSGPLADFIRADVEQQNADTTGYLGPDDPYLVKIKKDSYAMRLRHVREDHDMRTWDELYINGEAADPRLLYLPVGDDRYEALGHRLGCLMDGAVAFLVYAPIERDAERIAPPDPYVADITGQCYDGACPRPVWRVINATPFLAEAVDGAEQLATLEPGELLTPLRSETHVTGGRLIVTMDHERFFEDDILYLLDSQAEGFYRVWHYGAVFVIDASGIDIEARVDYCERKLACWATGQKLSQETWWSKVRRADGTEGWVRDPLRSIDGVLRSD